MLYIIVCGIVSLPADREHGPCSQGISRDPEKDWRTIMAYNILFTSLFSVGKDVSLKLIHIQESIMYFIQAYDKVAEIVSDKDFSSVRITVKEVKAAARRMDRERRDSRR